MSLIISKLIEKNIISKNTEMCVATKRPTLDGQNIDKNVLVVVEEIKDNHLVCRCLEYNISLSVTFDKVKSIDGMEITRFAEVYNIKSDGSEKEIRPRGRKRKYDINISYTA